VNLDKRCVFCGESIELKNPHHQIEGDYCCVDCAFKRGMITGEYYLNIHGIGVPFFKAFVMNDEIYVMPIRKQKKQNERQTPEAIVWRNIVFERDNYACRRCGKRGGTLNAHHVKSFAKYPSERTNPENGITLCYDCHKAAHSIRREK
jgi:hypothetical protein